MKLFSTAAVLLAWSGVASAHVGHEGATFGNGLAHPFGGLDHLLAMVAVGLLGAHRGGHWRYLLPVGFVAGLGLGGLLSAFEIGLPAVELSIALSVLLLGVLLSLGTRVSPWVLGAVVLIAGLPHGHAHLAEAGSGSLIGYGVGMVLGSALLHAGGLLAGLAIGRAKAMQDRWQWVAGSSLACAGLVLAVLL
jgi:urease accessory protein